MTKSAHLIGICGAGMSAVARLLQESGYHVTGSDEGFYPPVSDYLTRIGLTCAIGYRAANIPKDVDLIVIGKHAKLVPESNEEVAEALSKHKSRVRSFPEILAVLTANRTRMVVAGSYGKSSLTSLITWCLLYAGKNPGWFIGAIPKGFEHSSSIGGTGPFVFEGDEYPSANWDKRPKFAHYRPETVLLTSATHDHVNIYPTLGDYHQPFHVLLTQLHETDGKLIACTDEQYAANFFHAYTGPKTSYGLSAGRDYSAAHITLGDPLSGTPTTFALLIGISMYSGFKTHAIGLHSVENIVGAAAYLIGEKHLSIEEFKEAVESFKGLERRLDRKAPRSTLPIYEGFGSSSEKARAAIDAMTAHFPQRRLIVLFEPHTFTWRNRAALDQYRNAFTGAATVWIFSPPHHGETAHDQASHDEIIEKAAAHHADIRRFSTESIDEILTDASPEHDLILILSSGSFGGCLTTLLASAEHTYPA